MSIGEAAVAMSCETGLGGDSGNKGKLQSPVSSKRRSESGSRVLWPEPNSCGFRCHEK